MISPSKEVNELLVSCETTPITTGVRFIDLLRRPQLSYQKLTPIDPTRPLLEQNIFEQIEIEVKYEGYIKRQMAQTEQMRRMENKKLPAGTDYRTLAGLRLEAQEKLNQVRPENIGQASRISGVSPADISVLIIWLSQRKEDQA